MIRRAVRSAAVRGVAGFVTVMAIGAAPAAADQGEPGSPGPPPAVPAGTGVDAADAPPEGAMSSPGPGPVAALLPSASVTAATRAALAAQEASGGTGPRAGGLGLPTLLYGVATWLRDDLPRHRRVLLYELDRGRGRVAGVLPGGPAMPGLAVVAGLAGLALTVRRRRTATVAPEAASAPPTDPAPASRFERARRLMAEGAGPARAARETGLGREGLELLDRLSAGSSRSEELRPWGTDRRPPASDPTPRRADHPAPFHALPEAMDPSPPSAAPGEGAP
jgi:hypothetical protein